VELCENAINEDRHRGTKLGTMFATTVFWIWIASLSVVSQEKKQPDEKRDLFSM